MNPFSNGRPNLSSSERIRNKRASTIYNAASRAFDPGLVSESSTVPCRNYNGNIGFYRYGRLRNAHNYRLLDDLNRGYALCRDCPDCPTGKARGVGCPRTAKIGPTMGLSSFLDYFGTFGPLSFPVVSLEARSCTGTGAGVTYSGSGTGCDPGSIAGWTGADSSLWKYNSITMPTNSDGRGVVLEPRTPVGYCDIPRPQDMPSGIQVQQGLQITGFLQPFFGLLDSAEKVGYTSGIPLVLVGYGPIGQFQTCGQIHASFKDDPPIPTGANNYQKLINFPPLWKSSNFMMGSDGKGMLGWRVVCGGLWGAREDSYGLQGLGTVMNNPADCCREINTEPAGSGPAGVLDAAGPTAGAVTVDIKVLAKHFFERNDVGNFFGVGPSSRGIWLINPLSLSANRPFVVGYTLGLSPGNLAGWIAETPSFTPIDPGFPIWYYASPPYPPFPPPAAPLAPAGQGGELLYNYWNYTLDFTGKAICGPDLTTGNDMRHTYLTCLGTPGKVAFAIPLQGCCGPASHTGATGCDGFLQDRMPFIGT